MWRRDEVILGGKGEKERGKRIGNWDQRWPQDCDSLSL